MWQETRALYIKTLVNLWYPVELSLEWEMFNKKSFQEPKLTNILCVCIYTYIYI